MIAPAPTSVRRSWPCATPGCDEVIHPTGRRGRPATYCPACRARRTPVPKARRPKPEVPPLQGAPTTVETVRCGCGRDYLTVPLEESHVCPRPRRRRVR